ncbi:helix-turn-helix transcriptional regulator [Pseudomonas veronii]|uniref:helix-turn-helix transcriptional regulator n=1 Tax=Pseudomonas veronii TaxID=76761 RepID=UPI002658573F|nr:helix-turn-helix transcriptional regulator [Pseudomonas veronii]WKC46939.1 helix-turn-helix transcriptional regulator [Pseudomonas veronii]
MVIVVVRACIESYIAMHWIFESPSIEHRRFRHQVWTLAWLYDRLGLHATTDEGRRKVSETQAQADELAAEVLASPLLSDYTDKQRRRVLKGDWRVDWSWSDQAVRAGFHQKYFESVYSHYCGYAYSSYISALQIRVSATSIDDQRMLG